MEKICKSLGGEINSKIISISLFKKCPGSLIYKAKDEKNRKYIIKKYKTKNTDLKNEFENQKRAYKIFKSYKGNIKIPHPIFFSKKNNIIAMEYIKGLTLTEYLRKKNLYFSGEKLKKIYYDVGVGLNYLHKKILEKTKIFLDAKMHKIINNIKRQPEYKQYLRVKKLINLKSIKYQRIHGNFKAENILIAGSKIYFIDFAYDYKSSIYYDLAKLIESSFTAGFRSWNFPRYNFQKIPDLKKALLNGYFGNLNKVNIDILNYYQILFKIFDLSICKSKKLSFRILEWIYYFRIKNLIKQIKRRKQ